MEGFETGEQRCFIGVFGRRCRLKFVGSTTSKGFGGREATPLLFIVGTSFLAQPEIKTVFLSARFKLIHIAKQREVDVRVSQPPLAVAGPSQFGHFAIIDGRGDRKDDRLIWNCGLFRLTSAITTLVRWGCWRVRGRFGGGRSYLLKGGSLSVFNRVPPREGDVLRHCLSLPRLCQLDLSKLLQNDCISLLVDEFAGRRTSRILIGEAKLCVRCKQQEEEK